MGDLMKVSAYVKGGGVTKWKEACVAFNREELQFSAFKDETFSGTAIVTASCKGWIIGDMIDKKECPKHAESGFSIVDPKLKIRRRPVKSSSLSLRLPFVRCGRI